MEISNTSFYLIGGAAVVILSYLLNYVCCKTNIPHVLVLIALGFGIKHIALNNGYSEINMMPGLEILGKIGLILIVLEAAMHVKISKAKWPIIWRSFVTTLIVLLATSLVTMYIIHLILEVGYYTSLLYAIPLSIMSSAIIIPCLSHMSRFTREFLIYEATFSDILGMLFFYSMLDSSGQEISFQNITLFLFGNISITVIVAIVVTIIIVFAFGSIKGNVKFFTIFSCLILLYGLSKLLHLSAPLMILVFGLLVNNRKLFFRGVLSKLIVPESFDPKIKDFKTFTDESTFLLRTFFFVIFGMMLSPECAINIKVIEISVIAVIALYTLRYINLKVIRRSKEILPELFIAPRGLVTIVLFYAIPQKYLVGRFEEGIVLLIIVMTNIIMMFTMIFSQRKASKKKAEPALKKE